MTPPQPVRKPVVKLTPKVIAKPKPKPKPKPKQVAKKPKTVMKPKPKPIAKPKPLPKNKKKRSVTSKVFPMLLNQPKNPKIVEKPEPDVGAKVIEEPEPVVVAKVVVSEVVDEVIEEPLPVVSKVAVVEEPKPLSKSEIRERQLKKKYLVTKI